MHQSNVVGFCSIKNLPLKPGITFLRSLDVLYFCFEIAGTYLAVEEFGSDCNRLCSSVNLSCSSDFSTFSINNSGISCKRSQDNETWTLEYHPSYNNETGECEGFTEIHNTKGCESVRAPEHHRRFCMCVRPGK